MPCDKKDWCMDMGACIPKACQNCDSNVPDNVTDTANQPYHTTHPPAGKRTARNEGEQWYADYSYSWMNDDQWKCFELLCDLCGGSNHIGGRPKALNDLGIEISLRYGFHASTFDYDGLTRAVVLAHDRGVRVEIRPGAPGALKLFFTAVEHPDLSDKVEEIRKQFA